MSFDLHEAEEQPSYVIFEPVVDEATNTQFYALGMSEEGDVVSEARVNFGTYLDRLRKFFFGEKWKLSSFVLPKSGLHASGAVSAFNRRDELWKIMYARNAKRFEDTLRVQEGKEREEEIAQALKSANESIDLLRKIIMRIRYLRVCESDPRVIQVEEENFRSLSNDIIHSVSEGEDPNIGVPSPDVSFVSRLRTFCQKVVKEKVSKKQEEQRSSSERELFKKEALALLDRETLSWGSGTCHPILSDWPDIIRTFSYWRDEEMACFSLCFLLTFAYEIGTSIPRNPCEQTTSIDTSHFGPFFDTEWIVEQKIIPQNMEDHLAFVVQCLQNFVVPSWTQFWDCLRKESSIENGRLAELSTESLPTERTKTYKAPDKKQKEEEFEEGFEESVTSTGDDDFYEGTNEILGSDDEGGDVHAKMDTLYHLHHQEFDTHSSGANMDEDTLGPEIDKRLEAIRSTDEMSGLMEGDFDADVDLDLEDLEKDLEWQRASAIHSTHERKPVPKESRTMSTSEQKEVRLEEKEEGKKKRTSPHIESLREQNQPIRISLHESKPVSPHEKPTKTEEGGEETHFRGAGEKKQTKETRKIDERKASEGKMTDVDRMAEHLRQIVSKERSELEILKKKRMLLEKRAKELEEQKELKKRTEELALLHNEIHRLREMKSREMQKVNDMREQLNFLEEDGCAMILSDGDEINLSILEQDQKLMEDQSEEARNHIEKLEQLLKGMMVGLDASDAGTSRGGIDVYPCEIKPETTSIRPQRPTTAKGQTTFELHPTSKEKEVEPCPPPDDSTESHFLSRESFDDPSSPLSMSDTDFDIEPRKTPPGPMMELCDAPRHLYEEDMSFRRSNLPPPRRTVVIPLEKEEEEEELAEETIVDKVGPAPTTTDTRKHEDRDAGLVPLPDGGDRIDPKSMDPHDGIVRNAHEESAQMVEEEEWEKKRKYLSPSHSSHQPHHPSMFDRSDEYKDMVPVTPRSVSDRSGERSWKDSDLIDIETVSPISATSLSNSSHTSRRSIESKFRVEKKTRKQKAASVSEEEKRRKSKFAMERAKRRAAERLRQEKEARMMREKELEDRRERLLKLELERRHQREVLAARAQFQSHSREDEGDSDDADDDRMGKPSNGESTPSLLSSTSHISRIGHSTANDSARSTSLQRDSKKGKMVADETEEDEKLLKRKSFSREDARQKALARARQARIAMRKKEEKEKAEKEEKEREKWRKRDENIRKFMEKTKKEEEEKQRKREEEKQRKNEEEALVEDGFQSKPHTPQKRSSKSAAMSSGRDSSYPKGAEIAKPRKRAVVEKGNDATVHDAEDERYSVSKKRTELKSSVDNPKMATTATESFVERKKVSPKPGDHIGKKKRRKARDIERSELPTGNVGSVKVFSPSPMCLPSEETKPSKGDGTKDLHEFVKLEEEAENEEILDLIDKEFQ